MDVPSVILDEQKCSSSETCLQHGDAAVCGRCYTPKSPKTRNTQNEATTKLLKYLCKNWESGCSEMVSFVQRAEVSTHEEVCEHRKYVCLVLGSARCNWLGPRTAMLAHWRDLHPGSVLENQCSLTHDITNDSVSNYIITIFHFLFLLHIKVCVVTGKIFYAVRLLEPTAEAAKFYFILDIKHGIEQLTMKGEVAPQGCLAIQEDTSLALDINSLLNVLGDFDDTTFTLTVKQRVSDAANQLAQSCGRCGVEVMVFLYRDNNGWRCESCVPAKRACRLCHTHTDIFDKCWKHELYFCQQRNICNICKVTVPQGSLFAHYVSAHQDITHEAESTWCATGIQKHYNYCLVSSAVGTVVCRYVLTESQFVLNVFTSIRSERLREFQCSVRVTDSANGHMYTFTPDTVMQSLDSSDWCIVIKNDGCFWWNVVFDVCVNITKV